MARPLSPISEFVPKDIVDIIRSRVSAEFATVSMEGVPIDTPTFVFSNNDLTTLISAIDGAVRTA